MMRTMTALSTAALIASSPVAAAELLAAHPGDDFYAYANADWLRTTRLPDGAAKIDTTSILKAQNAARVQVLIDAAVDASNAGRSAGKVEQKITDYYRTRLEPSAAATAGRASLDRDLAAIAAIADRHGLAVWLGRTIRLDDGTNQRTESLWGVWIHQDFHDPDRYAVHFMQGGLGLADPESYLDPVPVAVARRAEYRAHVADVLARAGLAEPEVRAEQVVELEIAIARTHASRADTDDVFKTDNSWSLGDFVTQAPGNDWPAYFAAAGIGPNARFVVWQPRSVTEGARLVSTVPLATWKDYLTFHQAEHYALVLQPDMRATPEAARQLRALAATEEVFGDAVGRLYVSRYLPPGGKARAAAMVANLRSAFRAKLDHSTWMTPVTRARAAAKLATLRIGLAYPETWTDYAPLVVIRGDALGNLRRAEEFAYARDLAKLGRPVDPDEWPAQLHAYNVGAVLDISPNTMEFAAGLLQPPFFDAEGDSAANYGSAGAGIAHEISHSFDELGNLYDERGRLGLWWTANDLAAYRAAAARLIAQLDTCSPAPGAVTNGKQVVAESASDLAGVAVAYDAYHLSLHGHPDAVKHGLTGDQRFFIAFASRWRRVQTGEARSAAIKADNHAAPPCRANLVRNLDAWVRAFGVKPGDALYLKPENRVRLW